MSYDIHLVPRRPEQSWEEALERVEEAHAPFTSQQVARCEEVMAQVRGLLGEQVEIARDAETIELSDPQTGLEVVLEADRACVSCPSRSRGDVGTFRQLLVDTVSIVSGITGWEAYDAQAEEAFDGRPGERLTWGSGADALPDARRGSGHGRGGLSPSARHRSGSQAVVPSTRRNFWVFLVCGVVALAVGVACLVVGVPLGAVAVGASLVALVMAARVRSRMRGVGSFGSYGLPDDKLA